ncbi:MAG TPA: amidohydrolase family protein [Terracidiphilus sp.]|nr:amidohydrolase family protein [Terracidiphilus sp.]
MLRWLKRLLVSVVVAMALFAFAIWLLEYYPRRDPHPPLRLAQGVLAIEHARIYTSPTDPPIPDGTIVIRDGLIAAVGADVQVPANATRILCEHCVVTAGFWNTHVHFSQPKWDFAEFKSGATLNAQLADMFLSRGFTTVADLGSNPADTITIRRRIERGKLDGPFIYTATQPLYPPHGIPYYLHAPAWLAALMPQPATPEEARRVVRRNIATGADLTKLFTGSWIGHGRVLPMPVDVATAAVEQSHALGKVVFAHPSNLAGVRVAMDAGVDVLAHAADDTRGVDNALLAAIVARHMVMIPTLKMFATTVTTDPGYLDPIYAEVRAFHQLGGTLMFGTDVGFMTDYSTEGEFEALGKCGLGWQDVLGMLTVNPAARMGVAAQKGTIAPGKLADLTILSADPAENLTNFSRVQAVIRSGRVIWQR